ncbi:hypothetical protein R3P38DRAFT_3228199 [Favolaschia claudopus]|uniref:Uncharacterized protein n=1 Tax=Favolaschia claudopus TaxID=2862362 RepID=A0AAV9ZRU4_9AGAR
MSLDGGASVWFASQTLDIIIRTTSAHAQLSYADRRSKSKIFAAIDSLPTPQRTAIRLAAEQLPRFKRKRTTAADPPRKKTRVSASDTTANDAGNSDSSDAADWFDGLTLTKSVGIVYEHTPLRPVDKRTRAALLLAVDKLDAEVKDRIQIAARNARQAIRRRIYEDTLDSSEENMDGDDDNDDDDLLAEYDVDDECFLRAPSEDVINACIAK